MTNESFIVRTANLRGYHTSYPLNGDQITYPRRDGRPGFCRAKIKSRSNGTIVLDLDWDQPHGGRNLQTYRATEDGGLLIENKIILKENGRTGQEQTVTYYVSFRRG
eukprot:CAMPEP_0167743008 /NCGR_PEP_ID=MMETSP0110_2-20121227/1767_1 /TAXON_ID=629695 /ORGANISM="Gymnochlora sp., Strain CCMP2014" /LENGTH=106 /DNA_ID=CAMNT_0007627311 /DNA_START=322 /DNA_END=642 /DNA_ORIENTATION=-